MLRPFASAYPGTANADFVNVIRLRGNIGLAAFLQLLGRDQPDGIVIPDVTSLPPVRIFYVDYLQDVTPLEW